MTSKPHWSNGVYIFYYHDVSEHSLVPNHIRTSPSRFNLEIEYIRAQFEVVSMDVAIRLIQEQTAQKPYAVICFDDGFKGTIENAVPVLKKLQIPAIFFLNGSFLSQKHVAEAIFVEFIQSRWSSEKIIRFFPEYNCQEKFRDYAKKHSSYEQFKYFHDLLGKEVLDQEIYANEKDLQSLETELFTIGNHTLNHLWLANLSAEEQGNEIKNNHELLRALPGYQNLLAVPYGSDKSFNQDTLFYLQDYSSNLLIKAVGGINHRFHEKFLSLERIGLSNEKPPIQELIQQRVYGPSVFSKTKRKVIQGIKRITAAAARGV